MARRKRRSASGPDFDLQIFLAGGITIGHSPSEGSQKETIMCVGKDNKIIGFFPHSQGEYKKAYSLMKAMQAGYAAEFELVDLAKEKWPWEAESLEARAPKKPKTDYSFTPEVMRAAMSDVLKRTERIPYMREAVNELRNLTPGNRGGIEGVLSVFVKLAGLGHRKYVSELAGILSMCHDAGLLPWEKPAQWTPEVIETEIPQLGAALSIHIPKIANVFEALYDTGLLTGVRPDALSITNMGHYSERAIAAINSLATADLSPIVAKALEVGLLEGQEPETYDRPTLTTCRDNIVIALGNLPAERQEKQDLEAQVEGLIDKGFEVGLLEGQGPDSYDPGSRRRYSDELLSALDELQGLRGSNEQLKSRVEQLEAQSSRGTQAYDEAVLAFNGDYSTRGQALAKLEEAVDAGNQNAQHAKSLYGNAMRIIREGDGGKAENAEAVNALNALQKQGFNVSAEIGLIDSLNRAKYLGGYKAEKAQDPAEKAQFLDSAKEILINALEIEPEFKGAEIFLERYSQG